MSRDVKIGERTLTVGDFRLRKVQMAGRRIARISRKVPDIQSSVAAFNRQYGEDNKVVWTRGMALLPEYKERFADVTEEQWAAVDGKIEMFPAPSQGEVIAHLFPKIMDAAEEEMLELLAVLVIPNSELRDAARSDTIPDKIDDYLSLLLDEATDEQLGELWDAAQAVLTGDEDGKGLLGKLQRAFSLTTPATQQETSSSSEPSSPTVSEAPTDGVTETSSTRSPGTSSAVAVS